MGAPPAPRLRSRARLPPAPAGRPRRRLPGHPLRRRRARRGGGRRRQGRHPPPRAGCRRRLPRLPGRARSAPGRPGRSPSGSPARAARPARRAAPRPGRGAPRRPPVRAVNPAGRIASCAPLRAGACLPAGPAAGTCAASPGGSRPRSVRARPPGLPPPRSSPSPCRRCADRCQPRRLAAEGDTLVEPLRGLHGLADGKAEPPDASCCSATVVKGGDDARGRVSRSTETTVNAVSRIRLAAFSAVPGQAGVTDRGPVKPGERDLEPGIPGQRLGFHRPVFPCNEGLDPGLALADQPERHRLHPRRRPRLPGPARRPRGRAALGRSVRGRHGPHKRDRELLDHSQARVLDHSQARV